LDTALLVLLMNGLHWRSLTGIRMVLTWSASRMRTSLVLGLARKRDRHGLLELEKSGTLGFDLFLFSFGLIPLTFPLRCRVRSRIIAVRLGQTG
jgi:hypothetical protein